LTDRWLLLESWQKISNGYLRKMMKKYILLALCGWLILFGTQLTARAEIKTVQMKISGYLCGN